MNKRDAFNTARMITWRACMMREDVNADELARLHMERMNIAGLDGFAFTYKDDPRMFCAAPHKRKPGKKQTCSVYSLDDVTAYADACDALSRDDYSTANRIWSRLKSADLKRRLAEGLDMLEAQLDLAELEAQMSEPLTDLDMVHELFDGYGFDITQKRPGCCIWISGDTKPHKNELKAFGFRWSPNKGAWYWKPAA